ncbi:hypothetical protein ACOMHN_001408 [Nucella lapillus]
MRTRSEVRFKLGLIATGAVLAGIGACGLLVCLFLCLHAYFIFNIRDQACQTNGLPWSDDLHNTTSPTTTPTTTQEVPGYAVINKPSSLKSADTLRRNGGGFGGNKKVTMAPDVALDADVRAPAQRTTSSGGGGGGGDFAAQGHVMSAAPNLTPASPASPGYRTLGSYAVVEHSGGSSLGAGGGGPAMEFFDQRSFAQNQPFQDAQGGKHQQTSHQSAVQHQRVETDIQRQRQQLEFHRQHLMQQQQQQPHQQPYKGQQPQHFRVQVQHQHQQQQQQPSSQAQNATYAQSQHYYPIPVQHSPSPSMSSQQSSVFTSPSISGGGGERGGGGFSGFNSMGTGVSGYAAGTGNREYGTGTSGYAAGSGSREYGTGSSMREYGTGTSSMGGYNVGTGSSVGTAKTSSSFGSYRIQTQGLQYQSGRPYREDDDYDNPAEGTPMMAQGTPTFATTSSSASAKDVSFGGGVRKAESEVPEPAPLQHPSERRPMTFEQQSSSKMSIYDNVLFPYAEAEGE